MTRCLLIDGEGSGRQQLAQMLASLGLETCLTSGTDEAIAFCNDNSPDLVMVSATARGVVPRDIVKRLHLGARGKPPVVIVYAETADTEMFGQTILEGAADVLMMPFDSDLLHFKLRQAGLAV